MTAKRKPRVRKWWGRFDKRNRLLNVQRQPGLAIETTWLKRRFGIEVRPVEIREVGGKR